MQKTIKFGLKSIIGAIAASFLMFAPQNASAAIPTAQQIYDFYDAGGPNCYATDAYEFCYNWAGCEAYGWWEYRWAFCEDGLDLANGDYYPTSGAINDPEQVISDLGISWGGVSWDDLDIVQMIRNGEANNYYTTDELKCIAIYEILDNGVIPLVDPDNPISSWDHNIFWWNAQTVDNYYEVNWVMSYYAQEFLYALESANSMYGRFPNTQEDMERHADYIAESMGLDCGDDYFSGLYPASESDYQLSCGSFNEIYDEMLVSRCPDSHEEFGGWIQSFFPENSYNWDMLAAMYNRENLYTAFCSTCGGAVNSNNPNCTKYSIAKAAGVQNVDSCNYPGKPSQSVITLNKNGGTGGVSSITVYTGTAANGATIPSLPTRTNYTFGGYYTGSSCNGTQYFGSNGKLIRQWTSSSNTTLYACWMSATTYTLNYSSVTNALDEGDYEGNFNCWGNHGGDGPMLVRCDCRTSEPDLLGGGDVTLYQIETPSYMNVACPTNALTESQYVSTSCSLSELYGDWDYGHVLCVSQDIINAAEDSCYDLCGCGDPWSGTPLYTDDTFYIDGADCDGGWCTKGSSNTSYISGEIWLSNPLYYPNCIAYESLDYGCAANMYVNKTNPDDGDWCSNCPSYTLADGTSQRGTLAAYTVNAQITQCTVPTTATLRGTNGNYKYKNACKYTK